MKCPTCGHYPMKQHQIPVHKQEFQGVIVEVKNFEFSECTLCGEKMYPAHSVRMLQKAADSIKEAQGCLESCRLDVAAAQLLRRAEESPPFDVLTGEGLSPHVNRVDIQIDGFIVRIQLSRDRIIDKTIMHLSIGKFPDGRANDIPEATIKKIVETFFQSDYQEMPSALGNSRQFIQM